MKLVHGSLFSGFDAPSIAASWMGWENAFHCEMVVLKLYGKPVAGTFTKSYTLLMR